MRTDFVVFPTSFLGMTSALRRSCKHNPNNYGEGWYYTVAGDTATILAADFCTRPEIIKQWNNVGENIPAGINIKVPCRERSRDCRRNDVNGWGNGAYTVKSGDTLIAIASDFCTDYQSLFGMNLNEIENADSIRVGQVIGVPCSFNN